MLINNYQMALLAETKNSACKNERYILSKERWKLLHKSQSCVFCLDFICLNCVKTLETTRIVPF